MPEMKDHDVERTGRREATVLDGMHNALISNPDLREAYNEAIEDGVSRLEAHERARREVFGDEYWEEEYADRVAEYKQEQGADDPPDESEGAESKSFLKHVPDDFDYEKVDDALLSAHEKCVQWNADKPLNEYDISKAPGIWESQDQVPEWVLDALEDLIRTGDAIWHGGYERLPPSAEAEIQMILEDRLTQPQGWSLSSLLRDLSDHYPDVDEDYLLNILRNETSAVLNTAREEAYESREDTEEYVYDWIGPNDHRTTDTCLSIEDRIEDEGGAVSMERLKEILYEEAMAHSDAEGTPERVDDWQPHYQCRRTFTRRVQSV